MTTQIVCEEKITEYTVKHARAKHDCACCDGTIRKGQSYIRTVKKINGKIEVTCTHADWNSCVFNRRYRDDY